MDRLVHQKKEALLQEKGDNGSLQSEHVVGRDILSVYNLVADVCMSWNSSQGKYGNQRFGEDDGLLLYDLAKPEGKPIQDRLRTELLTLSSAEPSIEELNALPYLDAAIRENLRLNAVASPVIREADRDDVILLSIPIVDQKGVEKREVRISNGDSVFVSVLAINRDRTIWGEDAYEFK
ncbi:hypothetical protein FRB93_010819 [Tulasnella sp. JGI-2019a]|nr:hypothetical protein FRB93_010819 [Tulasnella sp. JGI-2019a]